MQKVNIHEAKTHLSALIEKVNNGEEIIIAKAGKPVAKIIPYKELEKKPKTGFMKGQFTIPDDFDTMGADEIAKLFNYQPRSFL